MDWIHGAAYGAVGGALIEALVFNSRVLAWQAARRKARDEKRRKLPALRGYIDPPADLAAALSRILLGALVGWLLHSQITGLYAAVAAGASAPALLRQLGSFRTVQEVVQGGTSVAEAGNPEGLAHVPRMPEQARTLVESQPETPGEVSS